MIVTDMIAESTYNLNGEMLLDFLFEPQDIVEVRLIETWTEPKRESHVHANLFRRASMLKHEAAKLNQTARLCTANFFFGVCPRPVGKIGYGKSGYIDTVRVVWSDLDYCRPDEAEARVEAAGLPAASAVVDSGNGVHLYWGLDEPLLIPLTYLLDDRGNPILSEYAASVQQVIQGVAEKIGGDHTQDLARVLRLPGTMNRKNQRNGTSPVMCRLHSLDADRRYPFSLFEPFKAAVVAAHAPLTKKPLSASVKLEARREGVPWIELTDRQQQAIEELIEKSATAKDRSKADFSLCAFAYKLDLDPADLWGHVFDVGKFAERGESYFENTWARAKVKVDSWHHSLNELFGDIF